MSGKAIVLDANILIRAVLGKRVRELIFDNVTTVKFFAPDVAYADDSSAAMLVLDRLEGVVQSIDAELYAGMQQQALQRIAVRDADDWPVLACAMTLGCPVWTEDADFFGTGVATWTSDRIALYLA
jgi:predicted nucleic acid-binding protein